jgi:hypothetical protein
VIGGWWVIVVVVMGDLGSGMTGDEGDL